MQPDTLIYNKAESRIACKALLPALRTFRMIVVAEVTLLMINTECGG